MNSLSIEDIEGILNISVSIWTKFSTKTLKECVEYMLNNSTFDKQTKEEYLSQIDNNIDNWSLSSGSFGIKLTYNHRSLPSQTLIISLNKLYNESFVSAKQKKIIS